MRIGFTHGHTIIPHGDADALLIAARQMDVDVLLWGGTHKFEAYELEGKFFVNPGSATGAFSTLWGSDVEEPTPSFCLMDVSIPPYSPLQWICDGSKCMGANDVISNCRSRVMSSCFMSISYEPMRRGMRMSLLRRSRIDGRRLLLLRSRNLGRLACSMNRRRKRFDRSMMACGYSDTACTPFIEVERLQVPTISLSATMLGAWTSTSTPS